MVDVPNVIGISEAKAKSYIEDKGLVAVIRQRDLKAGEKYYEKGYVIAQDPGVEQTAQVKEGSTVTIEVSTGVINFNLTINSIPKDFVNQTATLSIWVDGGKLLKESETLDFSSVNSYTFKELKTTDKSFTAVIKLKNGNSYEDYQTISVDALSGNYKVVSSNNNYSKRSNDTSNQGGLPSQSDNSSGSNNN